MKVLVGMMVVPLMGALGGCAQTHVSPMARDTFRVETEAALICGSDATRKLAQQHAAVEVLRRGGDLFVIEAEGGDYDGWMELYTRGLTVRQVTTGTDEAVNALSAREVLGPEWRALMVNGAPTTCV